MEEEGAWFVAIARLTVALRKILATQIPQVIRIHEFVGSLETAKNYTMYVLYYVSNMYIYI